MSVLEGDHSIVGSNDRSKGNLEDSKLRCTRTDGREEDPRLSYQKRSNEVVPLLCSFALESSMNLTRRGPCIWWRWRNEWCNKRERERAITALKVEWGFWGFRRSPVQNIDRFAYEEQGQVRTIWERWSISNYLQSILRFTAICLPLSVSRLQSRWNGHVITAM